MNLISGAVKSAIFGGCLGYLIGQYLPIEACTIFVFAGAVWIPRLFLLIL